MWFLRGLPRGYWFFFGVFFGAAVGRCPSSRSSIGGLSAVFRMSSSVRSPLRPLRASAPARSAGASRPPEPRLTEVKQRSPQGSPGWWIRRETGEPRRMDVRWLVDAPSSARRQGRCERRGGGACPFRGSPCADGPPALVAWWEHGGARLRGDPRGHRSNRRDSSPEERRGLARRVRSGAVWIGAASGPRRG